MLIRNHQNSVFSISTSEEPAILRFSDPTHRGLGELQAELEWISYLSENGVGIAAPLRSLQRALVEEINDAGSTCFASVFAIACGVPLNLTSKFDYSILNHWGRELGKIHQLSMRYEPKTVRKSFHEYAWYGVDPVSSKSTSDPTLMAIHQFNEWIRNLPKSPEVYGMIHGDPCNFHIESNQVTFFDLDDCTYHWYAYDIANGLYSLMFDIETSQLNINFQDCMEEFIRGYREEKELDSVWSDRVPDFILYRTGLLYQWLLAPETGPLWVTRIDDNWKGILFEWAKTKLTTKLNLT